MSGANVYTGLTHLLGGTLKAGTSSNGSLNGPFGSASSILIDFGATLDLNGFNVSIDSLSNHGRGTINLDKGILTIQNGSNATFGGTIQGTSGGLFLNGGTLSLTGPKSFHGPIKIRKKASLELKGSSQVDNIVNEGSLKTSETIRCKTYTQTADASLILEFANPYSIGSIDAEGAVSLAGHLSISSNSPPCQGGSYTLIQGSSISGTLILQNNPFPKSKISYSPTTVDLVFPSPGCSFVWNLSGNGMWGDPSHWSPSLFSPGLCTPPATNSVFFPNLEMKQVVIPIESEDSPISALSLFQIEFDAPDTDYLLQGTSTTITLDGPPGSNPSIVISGGNHSYTGNFHFKKNGTLLLNKGSLSLLGGNSQFLSGSSLTIQGTNGILSTQIDCTPEEIHIEGGTIINRGATNYFSPLSRLSISGGSLQNLDGAILGVAQTPLTISGGSVYNDATSSLQASTLTLSKGILTTQSSIQVSSYKQHRGALLQLDFTPSSFGQIQATGEVSLGGRLILSNTGASPSPLHHIVLLEASSISGSFHLVDTSIFTGSQLFYTPTQVYLELPVHGTWIGPSQHWNLATNWEKGWIPGLASRRGDFARFTDVPSISSPITVSLDDPSKQAQFLNLNQFLLHSQNNSYIFQTAQNGEGAISMGGPGTPLIQVTSPSKISHTMHIPIQLNKDTTLSFSNHSHLSLGISGSIQGHAKLTIQGEGTLENLGTLSLGSLVLAEATIRNEGILNADTILLSSGKLSTTKPIATTHFTQSAANLTLSVPNTTEFGQILATGPLSLGGSLTIVQTEPILKIGQVTLLEGSSLTGAFDSITNPFWDGILHVSTSSHRVYLNFGGCHGTWNSPISSLWTTKNWIPSQCYPGLNPSNLDDTATFQDFPEAPPFLTVTTPTPLSLYRLQFHAAKTQFTISGSGSISFEGAEGPTQILLSQGTHTIDLPLLLNMDTQVTTTRGTLQLGPQAYVTGNNTWTLLPGRGKVENYGTIAPRKIALLGGTLSNQKGATLGGAAVDIQFDEGLLINQGTVIAKDYTQGEHGKLQLQIADSDHFGSLEIKGSSSLNGTLIVEALSNHSLQENQIFPLIKAHQGLGETTFLDSLFQNFPSHLIPSLVYHQKGLDLTLKKALPVHLEGKTDLHFQSISQHNTLILTKCTQIHESLSPSMNFSFGKPLSLVAQAESLIERKQEQLAFRLPKSQKNWNLYGGPTASYGHVNTKKSQIGFGYHSVGALIGFDTILPLEESRPYYVGVGWAFDYQNKMGIMEDDWGNLRIEKIHTSLYATVLPKSMRQLAINGVVGFGFAWDTLHRQIDLGAPNFAIGKTKELLFDGLIDIEYHFGKETLPSLPQGLHFTSLFNLQYVRDQVSSYTEYGAGDFDLQIGALKPQWLNTTLGGRVSYRTKKYFRFELNGGWQREFLNRDQTIKVTAFHVTDQSARSTCYGMGKNSFLLGVDVLGSFCDQFQIEGSCDFKWNALFFNAFFYLGVGGQF